MKFIFNPFVTGGASTARHNVPGEFGLTSAMRRGATRRVIFATARPLYVPGGQIRDSEWYLRHLTPPQYPRYFPRVNCDSGKCK